MSSSTSSFNLLKNVSVAVATFLAAYIILGMLLEWVVVYKTKKNNYYQTIDSKIKHMMINHCCDDLAVVFVGNSKTEYHVNTYKLNLKGLSSYNLGVSGAKLINYNHFFDQVVKVKPNTIVLSVPLDLLYRKNWKLPLSIKFGDIKSVYQSGGTISLVFNAFLKYLWGTNKIRVYADNISGFIKDFYRKLDFNYLSYQRPIKSDVNPDDVGNMGGCVPMRISRTENKKIIKCASGDSVLLGGYFSEDKPVVRTVLKEPNPEKVRFLEFIIKKAKSKGVNVVLVFEPWYQTQFIYNIEGLEEKIGAKIIDLTNSDIKKNKSLWSDNGHFNSDGRDVYTEILAKKLSPLLK